MDCLPGDSDSSTGRHSAVREWAAAAAGEPQHGGTGQVVLPGAQHPAAAHQVEQDPVGGRAGVAGDLGQLARGAAGGRSLSKGASTRSSALSTAEVADLGTVTTSSGCGGSCGYSACRFHLTIHVLQLA